MTSANDESGGGSRARARAAVLALALAGGCAAAPSGRPRDLRAFLLAYDDNRPSATLTFPTLTYETLLRFELPPGQHRPFRLWMMAASPGNLIVSLYKNTVLEAPGDPFDSFTREIGPEEASTGKDGRWLVEDLQDLDKIDGVVWIGIRKVGGNPALWTSPSATSGQSFLRDRDPTRGVGILPVKRVPFVRLELAPPDLPRTPAPASTKPAADATASSSP